VRSATSKTAGVLAGAVCCAAAAYGLATASATAVSVSRMIDLRTDSVIPSGKHRAQAFEAGQEAARPIALRASRAHGRGLSMLERRPRRAPGPPACEA
jgi:hypothetical protein